MTPTPDPLREALADDLGETHDHELPMHDVWADVFLGQADALIARGWTRDALAQPAPALDVERLREALISIRRKSDPGVSLAGYRPPTDERGERLNAIFLIADAVLSDPFYCVACGDLLPREAAYCAEHAHLGDPA